MNDNFMCSHCKEKMAVVFITKIVDGKQTQEGICLSCARKMGIQPVNHFLEQAGITDEELDNLNDEMATIFEEGGFDKLLKGASPNFLMPMRLNSTDETPSKDFSSDKQMSKKKGQPDKEKTDKREKFKYLDTYGVNLIQKAYQGKLDNVIGRQRNRQGNTDIKQKNKKQSRFIGGTWGWKNSYC